MDTLHLDRPVADPRFDTTWGDGHIIISCYRQLQVPDFQGLTNVSHVLLSKHIWKSWSPGDSPLIMPSHFFRFYLLAFREPPMDIGTEVIFIRSDTTLFSPHRLFDPKRVAPQISLTNLQGKMQSPQAWDGLSPPESQSRIFELDLDFTSSCSMVQGR
jgi:hypothetical protein